MVILNVMTIFNCKSLLLQSRTALIALTSYATVITIALVIVSIFCGVYHASSKDKPELAEFSDMSVIKM